MIADDKKIERARQLYALAARSCDLLAFGEAVSILRREPTAKRSRVHRERCMQVRIAEERTRGKVASGIRRIRRLGRKGLLGGCLIECTYVRYGLLGGERWKSEAGNTGDKNNPECLSHKFSSHNSKCMGFHKCFFLRTMTHSRFRCRPSGRIAVEVVLRCDQFVCQFIAEASPPA